MDKFTKAQHFIPRQLLKHFSYPKNIFSKNVDYEIWQYDKLGKISDIQIDIKNICFQNNLYEFRDDSGFIVDRNYLEKCLSKMEMHFDKLIYKIESHDKLNDADIQWLYFMMATQLLRTPKILKLNAMLIKQYNDMHTHMNLSEQQIKNIARYSSIFHGSTDINENWSLLMVLDMLIEYNFMIWHSDYQFIISGSNPVLCLKPYASMLPLWVLPVSCHECVVLTLGKSKNVYCNVSYRWTQFVNHLMWITSDRFIYSKDKLFFADKRKYNMDLI